MYLITAHAFERWGLRFRPRGRPAERGITLIEILIASGILAVVTLTAIGSMVMASALSRFAHEDMMAVEIANRQIELIRSAPSYRHLGTLEVWNTTSTPPSLTFPAFLNGDFTGSQYKAVYNDESVQYDPQFPANGPTFNISYEWYGFGVAQSATNNSITVRVFTGQPHYQDWSKVDFTGRRLLIREGSGRGQIANITAQSSSASACTLSTSCALNGYSTTGWSVNPAFGSYFEVDGGKTVKVTITWTKRGRQSSQGRIVRWAFVPFRVDSDAAGTPLPLWPI